MKLNWFIKDEEKKEAIFEEGICKVGDVVRIKENTPKDVRTWEHLGGRSVSVTLPCGHLGRVVRTNFMGILVLWDNYPPPSQTIKTFFHEKNDGWLITSEYIEIYKGVRIIKNENDMAT
jgi:hypothetical protein